MKPETILKAFAASAMLTLAPLRAQDAPVMDLSMAREPSGTAWQPDAVGHHGLHEMAGDWMVMVHGNLFAVQDWQAKPRAMPLSASGGGCSWHGGTGSATALNSR